MSKRTKSPNSKNESGNATSDKSKVPKKIPQSSSKEVKDVNIDVDLNEELKCPICLDYLTRPRECSACGHLFCAPCIAHLKSCPLCRIKPFVSRDNRFSSRLVGNIRVNCDKCKAQIFRSELEEHKKTCENRLRHCIIKDCGFSAASDEEALSHLNTAHKGQLWSTLERLSRTNSPGEYSFIPGGGFLSLEYGKMMLAREKYAFGETRKLDATKNLLTFKFKEIHLKSNRVEFGIRSANNQAICSFRLTGSHHITITIVEGDKRNIVSGRYVPKTSQALSQYGVEVNTAFRTIRFFHNGQQVHDDDIPISWTGAMLEQMAFCVMLHDPGDCVRIIA